MKFNLEDYSDSMEYAMHCPEEWMAEEFCDFLHKNGRKWCNGQSYKEETSYWHYQNDTVYLFNKGRFGSSNPDYKTLEFTDFIFNIDEKTFSPDSLDIETIDMFLGQFPVTQ